MLVLSGHDVGRLNRCSMCTHEAHENHLNRLYLAYNWVNLSDFQIIVDNSANTTMGCKQLLRYVYTINNRGMTIQEVRSKLKFSYEFDKYCRILKTQQKQHIVCKFATSTLRFCMYFEVSFFNKNATRVHFKAIKGLVFIFFNLFEF